MVLVTPTVEEALASLLAPERERLKFQFEQGVCAFAKLKNEWAGLYVGCHMEQVPYMDLVLTEGRWSIGRKKQE